MIECPLLRVPPKPEAERRGNCFDNGSQGAVSWGNCLDCRHHRGHDETRLVVICGAGPKEVELKSVPI